MTDDGLNLRALIDASPDAVVVVRTSDGIILFVNEQVSHLFWWTKEELIGQPINILIPDRIKERHQVAREQYSHHPTSRPMGVGLDLYGRRKDGTEFPVDISLSNVEDPDIGNITMAFVRDTTERDRTRARLALAQQAERLSSSVDKMTESIGELVKKDRRRRLQLIVLAGSVLLDFILSAGFFWSLNKTDDLVKDISRANESNHIICEARNDQSIKQRVLWDGILNLPRAEGEPPQDPEVIATFNALLEDTFALQDCDTLSSDGR